MGSSEEQDRGMSSGTRVLEPPQHRRGKKFVGSLEFPNGTGGCTR